MGKCRPELFFLWITNLLYMECVPAPACCYWIVSFSYYHVLSTEGKSSKNVHRKIMEKYVSPCKVTMSKKVKWDIKYNLSRLYDTVIIFVPYYLSGDFYHVKILIFSRKNLSECWQAIRVQQWKITT